MRKLWVLLVLVLAIAVLITPALAQEETPPFTAPETPQASTSAPQDTGNNNQNQGNQSQQVHRIRLAYLTQNGPVLVPYIDGQPTAIQNMQGSAVSGWVEFAGPVTLSLIPLGDARSNAVVGPIELGRSFSPWTTIVVSENAGDWNAYAIRETLGSVPEGCARVTVFQAFSDTAANVGSTDSSQQSDQASQTMMNLGCGTVDTGSQQGSTGAQGNNLSDTQSGQAGNLSSAGIGAVDCVAIVGGAQGGLGNTSAQGSQGAQGNTQSDTQDTAMASFGSTVSNCAFTFDILAGTTSAEAMSSTGLAAFQDMPATTFQARNYYFIAAYGSQSNPQFVVWNAPAGPISNLIGNAQDSQQGSQGAQSDNQDDSGSDSDS